MTKHYILDISLSQPEHEFWSKLTDEEYVEYVIRHLKNFPHNVTWIDTVEVKNE